MSSLNFRERFKDKVSKVGKLGELEIDSTKAVNTGPNHSKNYKSVMQVSASNIVKGNLYFPDSHLQMKQDFARPIKLQGEYPPANQYDRYSIPTKNLPDKIDSAVSKEFLTAQNSLNSTPLVNQKINRKVTHSAQPLRKTNNSVRPDDSKSETGEMKEYQRRRTYQDFKPYTMNDYRNIKQEKYFELGGLGAFNIGTEEWKKKKELQDRRAEYAKCVQQANSSRLPVQTKKPEQTLGRKVSVRERALSFAKQIKKPPLKPENPKNSTFKEPISALQTLEQQHEQLKASVQNIRNHI